MARAKANTDDRGEVILYRTEDGRTALDVRLAGEPVWLTQAQIAELFGTKRPAITKHLEIYLKSKTYPQNQYVPFWNILGNKRIGSFLFILFLRENDYLEDANGQVKINDNALVALALLIAESEPRNKELMIRLVVNLLVDHSEQ